MFSDIEGSARMPTTTDISGSGPLLEVILPPESPGASSLGLPAPGRVGQRVDITIDIHGSSHLVCHEPGRWLALFDQDGLCDSFAMLARRAEADMLDVTWQWARFAVQPASASWVWATATALPPEALKNGAAVGRFADVRAVLVAALEGEGSPNSGFEVLVPAGYRDHVLRWLSDHVEAACSTY